MAENKTALAGLKVNTGTYRGSAYSQVVGVTVTDIDITLEFVYINPREKTQGEVVSRITLPRKVGEDLAKTILNTIAVHGKQKKGEKNE